MPFSLSGYFYKFLMDDSSTHVWNPSPKIQIAEQILQRMQWHTTHGVELECVVPKRLMPRNSLDISSKALWLMSDLASYGWSTQHESLTVDFEHEQSLEFSSPVYRKTRNVDAHKIAEKLSKWGAFVNDSCGLHIHSGLKDKFPDDQIDAIAHQLLINYIYAEQDLVLVEREQIILYKEKQFFGPPPEPIRTRKRPVNEIADDALQNPTYYDGNIRPIRYQFAFEKHGTIEWRGPAGTLCPIQVAGALLFKDEMIGLAAKMIDSNPNVRIPNKEELRQIQTMATHYNRALNVSDMYDQNPDLDPNAPEFSFE